MDAKSVIAMLGIGLVAGFLASLVVGGGGLITYIIWGILGSVLGGALLPMLGVKLQLGNPLVNQIAVSTIGAIIVVLAARLIA